MIIVEALSKTIDDVEVSWRDQQIKSIKIASKMQPKRVSIGTSDVRHNFNSNQSEQVFDLLIG